ncbi:uncharacterized protein LOC131425202 isoform X2 [Malaya genurostris]|uniref:uncharacterized protein LOC131425202 isoform X2 n=1 Tax=Malaya genurostris TaxID=325434 RepID=UPI0026F3919A|nr:uncharacterized protein LOC131425202 isoform X2 [Malaya genurostris]
MSDTHQSSLLSGIQAVRLFWSVHNERRRSSQVSQLTQRSRSSSDDVCSDVVAAAAAEDQDPVKVESKICRICRAGDDSLVDNLCNCKGSIGHIHERCLRLWTVYRRSQVCEICHCKFRWELDSNLSDWRLIGNFFRRRYFWVLLRDLLNFAVLFGISALQNANIVSMVQEEREHGFTAVLPLALVCASCYDMFFTRWVVNRTLKAYNLVREYWTMAHDDEFLGYFDEDFAVYGENQMEIENMLLAEYEAPD